MSTQRVHSRPIAGHARLAAAGAALALAVTTAAAPAHASADSCADPQIIAAGGAELLRLSALDLRPAGVDLPPLVDDRLSTASTAVSSLADPKARAAADLVSGGLPLSALGLTAPPGDSIARSAPPNDAPAAHTMDHRDLGVLSADTGELTADAHWPGDLGCADGTEPITTARGNLENLTVLPMGGDRSLLSVPGLAYGETGAELVRTTGRADRVAAHATAGVTDVYLMRGTPAETRIRVLSPSELRVSTDGTRENGEVDYRSPILEIDKAGGGTERLDSPDRVIEMGLPGVSLNPHGLLSGLFSRLGLSRLTGEPPLPEALDGALDPSLPNPDLAGTGLPDLGLDGLGLGLPFSSAPEVGAEEDAEAPVASTDLRELVTVRLSLGHVDARVYEHAVVAEAAALRLEVYAKVPGAERPVPVLDVGVGMLSAAVAVPQFGPDPGQPTPTPSQTPSAEASPSSPPGGERPDVSADDPGSLPVTGTGGLLTLIGIGVLLVIAGRGVYLLARKRGAGGDAPD